MYDYEYDADDGEMEDVRHLVPRRSSRSRKPPAPKEVCRIRKYFWL